MRADTNQWNTYLGQKDRAGFCPKTIYQVNGATDTLLTCTKRRNHWFKCKWIPLPRQSMMVEEPQ